METWHIRLKRAREAKNLKQVEVARLVGVKGATYSEWESGGIKTLSAENLVQVCKVLGMSEQYLMKGKEPVPGQKDQGGRSGSGK